MEIEYKPSLNNNLKLMQMKKTYPLLLLFMVYGAMAQTNCEMKLDSIQKTMESNSLFIDYQEILLNILPCADGGDGATQNLVGLMYLQGMGIEKDEATAFSYLEKSALNDNVLGQNNLGNLYREGIGCPIDMEKAVAWYEKAAEKKNEQALYSLGYMYLKGLGVPQDYSRAVAWFEKTEFGMAKHWLGVCYYLGYGVPQNTDKALEYLYGNSTLNSVAFLENLKTDKREQVEQQVNEAIEEVAPADKEIVVQAIETPNSDEQTNTELLTSSTIIGEWTGLLIDYDWSGKIPTRVLPIEVSFSQNELGDLQTKIVFNGITFEDIALLDSNSLFVQGLQFNIPQLYAHDLINADLEYTILGMDLSQKTHNNIPYLLADVDSFISNWKEPGTPISLVLRVKNANALTEEDQKIMLALAAQKTEFIKVYPVPFKEQLYVAFELANPAQVQVTLTSVATAQTVQVATTNLGAGMQSYSVDTANLPNGYYVVRVQEGDKLHSRIVIKQ
jgi:TPR repeat protein